AAIVKTRHCAENRCCISAITNGENLMLHLSHHQRRRLNAASLPSPTAKTRRCISAITNGEDSTLHLSYHQRRRLDAASLPSPTAKTRRCISAITCSVAVSIKL
ncbi:Hypothetical predicted protein, partial [Pelobates cultripes]